MIQTQILSENASSRRVLANLSLAIDEARLVRQIVSISDNLRRIENLPEEESRVNFLRKEMIRLELDLSETRQLAQSYSSEDE